MPHRVKTQKDYKCSFCGKSRDQVQYLVSGPPNVYICEECVWACNEVLNDYGIKPPEQVAQRTEISIESKPDETK